MEIAIRLEREGDHREVETLTREAFWNHYAPGCNEHYLVRIMRSCPAFVRELNYVALHAGRIVGSIFYTRAHILEDGGQRHPVLCLGPVSVLPECQGQGVGSLLIEHTKAAARALGHTAVLLLGDPAFYERVGFVGARRYGIGTAWDAYTPSLLACELVEGALEGFGGRFMTDPVFEIDEEKAQAFDRDFPPKQRLFGTQSQERFLQLVAMSTPRK